MAAAGLVAAAWVTLEARIVQAVEQAGRVVQGSAILCRLTLRLQPQRLLPVRVKRPAARRVARAMAGMGRLVTLQHG